MRIAIDGRWTARDTGGVRRYTLALVEHLLTLDDDHDYLVLTTPVEADPWPELAARSTRCRLLPLPYGLFSAATQVRLPGELARLGVDLYHAPNFMLPLRRGRYRTVVTIHDLIPLLHADLFAGSLKTRFRPVFRAILSRATTLADAVLTVSEFSAAELRATFPRAAAKVVPVPNGCSFAGRSPVDEAVWEAFRQRHGVRGAYALYVGRHDPSKNLARLVRAFGQVADETDLQLILAGRARTAEYPEPYRLIEQLGLDQRIVCCGEVSEPELRALYANARLFVFPSLYEGFGLPVLEAMASGCPVVCANATSLPEVASDAALLVDPTSVEAIAEGLRRAENDAELRATLIARGNERWRRFTWRAAAEGVRAVYERVHER